MNIGKNRRRGIEMIEYWEDRSERGRRREEYSIRYNIIYV
jgi:hypothetical protein